MDANYPRFSRPALGAVLVGPVLVLGLAVAVIAAWPTPPDAPGGVRLAARPGGVRWVSRPRVVIIKSTRTLFLLDGPDLVRKYTVDLGIHPVGDKQMSGDLRTPIGLFRVATKNSDSCYHRFIGLDYPHLPAIARGVRHGWISAGEAARLRRAHARGECPDWGTALGGGIGIHGQRRGVDWTAGCIAVADSVIEELFSVLRVGDPVEILP